MQSTGVKMENKRTRMTGTRDPNQQETVTRAKKTKEFRKYKRIGCTHLCAVPLPATLDTKTSERRHSGGFGVTFGQNEDLVGGKLIRSNLPISLF